MNSETSVELDMAVERAEITRTRRFPYSISEAGTLRYKLNGSFTSVDLREFAAEIDRVGSELARIQR
jgi:hypothetical protein